MTPSELKHHVEATGSNYFSRASMRFFGDTMRNYGCRSAMVGDIECWELWRKHATSYGLQASVYFCKKTFKRVFLKN